MSILIAGKEPTAVKIGNQDVQAVYAGTEKVWPTAPVDPGELTLKSFQTFNNIQDLNHASVRTFDVVSMGVQPGDLVVIMKQGAGSGTYQRSGAWTGMDLTEAGVIPSMTGTTFTEYSQSPGRIIMRGFWKEGDTNPYETGSTNQKYGCALVAIFHGTVGKIVAEGWARTSSDVEPRIFAFDRAREETRGNIFSYHCKGNSYGMNLFDTPPTGWKIVGVAYYKGVDLRYNQMGLCYQDDTSGRELVYNEGRWTGGTKKMWMETVCRV